MKQTVIKVVKENDYYGIMENEDIAVSFNQETRDSAIETWKNIQIANMDSMLMKPEYSFGEINYIVNALINNHEVIVYINGKDSVEDIESRPKVNVATLSQDTIKVESFNITPYLRILHIGEISQLQQMWEGNLGNQKWKNVPEVNE